MSESDNYYVSSRGLMKSCNLYSKTPKSSIRYLLNYSQSDFNDLKKLTNPKIYVCSSAMQDFCNNLLPHIDFSFILVSGDCDETIPYDIFNGEEQLVKFINNKYLLHWYCQNMVVNHPKITLMPIGLDYHTMTSNTVWGNITCPKDQEIILNAIKLHSKPFYERKPLCYANFQFLMTTRYGHDRVDAANKIPSNLVYYEPSHIPRINTWNAQIEYAYVVSPHGNGLDCHRTWEALALGCIPIVKSSPLNKLYDELPVLIVNDWSDITDELLKNTIDSFKNKTFNYNKLSLKYWIDKMK